MADRYSCIIKNDRPQYSENFPVLVEVSALYTDNIDHGVIVLSKFKNIGDRPIVGLKVAVEAYEINGSSLGITDFQYLDFTASPGSEFGSKTPIELPDNNARKFRLTLKEVTFSDGQVQKNYNEKLCELPEAIPIANVLVDPDLIKQFKLETSAKCTGDYYPQRTHGLFLCACGTVNDETNAKCYHCSYSYHELVMMCSDDYLSPLAEERLAKEAEQKRLQEEAARIRKKKIKKLCAIFIPIAVVIITLIALFPGVIKPFFDNLSAYNSAKTLLENKEYDYAHDKFLALGDFSDSADMANQSIYLKAENYFNNGYYQDSIDVWDSLGSYSDSKDRINQAYDTWHDSDYQAAMTLKNDGKYTEAEQAFIALGDYSDSAAQAADCVELFKKAKYDSAVQLKNEGKYEDAKAVFTDLADYSDSKTQVNSCVELKKEADYKTATSLVTSGKYSEAIKIFVTLPGYKDSADQIKESRYLLGKATIKTDPKSAIAQFNTIGSYKDSDKLKRQANYYWGLACLSGKNYKEAVSAFKLAKGYKDSKKKLSVAKKGYAKVLNKERYNYVKSHFYNDDYTTYQYLKKLKKAKYKDSAKLYKKLYKWKITDVAINNNKNSIYDDSYVTSFETIYFHYDLEGGPPGGKAKIIIKVRWPDGSTGRNSNKCYAANDWWFSWKIRNPRYFESGYLTVRFYDGSGRKLYTKSMYVY